MPWTTGGLIVVDEDYTTAEVAEHLKISNGGDTYHLTVMSETLIGISNSEGGSTIAQIRKAEQDLLVETVGSPSFAADSIVWV